MFINYEEMQLINKCAQAIFKRAIHFNVHYLLFNLFVITYQNVGYRLLVGILDLLRVLRIFMLHWYQRQSDSILLPKFARLP